MVSFLFSKKPNPTILALFFNEQKKLLNWLSKNLKSYLNWVHTTYVEMATSADKVGWVGPKRQRTCWRIIEMVPYKKSYILALLNHNFKKFRKRQVVGMNKISLLICQCDRLQKKITIILNSRKEAQIYLSVVTRFL